MNDPSPKRAPAVRLHALGGEVAPPQIVADLQVVPRLPAQAKEHFWEALGPCLKEPVPPEVEGP